MAVLSTDLTAMASDPISMHFFKRIGSSITNCSCEEKEDMLTFYLKAT